MKEVRWEKEENYSLMISITTESNQSFLNVRRNEETEREKNIFG